MKVKLFALAAACVVFAGMTSAQARPYDASDDYQWEEPRTERSYKRRGARTERAYGRRSARTYRSAGGDHRGLGGRPRQWCGWWMRTQRGGGPELNLAWNWSRWGRPASPQVGAVVVWRHHVGEITGRAANGQWIVRSGNDGGRVRERPRSIAGAVFRI